MKKGPNAMALFRKRTPPTSRRALRRAHTRTLKAQAQAERKFRERAERLQVKARAKAEQKGRAKADRTSDGAVPSAEESPTVPESPTVQAGRAVSRRQRKKAARSASRSRVSSVRSYLGVARLLAPALAPIAYRAVSEIRGRVDLSRARKLGVGVEQLGSYTGHGASLSARIAGLDDSLDELVRVRSVGQNGAGRDAEQFRTDTRSRLSELTTAVHAAERMPTPRRRAAHDAVGADLDRIDADLLQRLGVR